jgi:hypothetical protein
MHRDLALGSATLGLSAAYYWMAASVPVSRLADAIGPQGLPKIYAVLLAALSLILIVRSTRDPGSGLRDPGGSDAGDPARSGSRGSRIPDARSRLFRAAGMVLMGVLYLVAVPWAGYLLTIAGLIVATTYYQGGKVGWQAAIVALGGGLFFWLLFVVLMGIAQPPGFFPPQW